MLYIGVHYKFLQMLLIKERRKACNDKKMKEEGVKIENKEAAGAFYFLEKAKDSVEVEKYIEDNICEGGKKYRIEGNTGRNAMTIDLGKYKFAVYPIKSHGIREKVIMLKTKEKIRYKSDKLTENLSADFESNHCFVILHSADNRFNFIFEQLLEDILEKIETYRNF